MSDDHEQATERREQEAHDDLRAPWLYLNREVSWLDFNERVLQLAEDPEVPLLERVKFCAIYTTNLDEYYMVRVAGLQDQIEAGVKTPPQRGLPPPQTRSARADRFPSSPTCRSAWRCSCATR